MVPVDPLLSEVDAQSGRLTFYYVGALADGVAASAHEVVATVDGGSAVRTKLGEDRRATVTFGTLAAGAHDIEVALAAPDGTTLCRHRYGITARTKRAKAVGRRLNNFVTEILDAPLTEGEVAFESPHEGWVFIGFDKPYAAAKAYLDGGAEPVVVFRPDEPSETMRWLKEGTHKVRVAGAAAGGRLAIRLVKPLKITARSFAKETTDIRVRNQGYGFDFFRKWIFSSFNILTMGGNWRLASAKDRMAWGNAQLQARGKGYKAASDIRPGNLELRASLEKIRGYVTGSAAYRDGLPLEVDEHKVNAPAEEMDAFAEATWEMVSDGKGMAMFADYCDLPSQPLTNLQAQVSALSAVMNTGNGHGMLVPEMYLATKRTERDAEAEVDRVLAYVESIRRAIPSGPSHIIHLFGGWLTIGEWSSDSSPEADVKVRYDRYLHRLATDPAFADVGGVGMSTLACDEEIARWMARIVHHYCIEGRTDSLAEKLGYRYRPEIVTNGDFMDGLNGWTAEPAAPDAIREERRIGYGGKKGQCRMARSDTEIGEHFAVFTRSEKAPSRLSQPIGNLVPGKLYMLTFCTADYDDVLAPGTREVDRTFSVSIEGAETLPELSWDVVVPDAKAIQKARKAGLPVHCVTVTHRIVFRAQAATGRLTFSDWKGAAERGGPVGGRQLLNFVRIAPYFSMTDCGGVGTDADAFAGTTVTVSKDFGFDPEDSTRFLQAALSSGAAKVVVDRQAADWVSTSLTGAPNQTVVFEPGVTLRAKPGTFHGRADCLLVYVNVSNVLITGYGATLKMERAIYDKPPYTKSEHRHTLNLRGVSNFRVEGLTCTESGGDGIFIGGGQRKNHVFYPPANVTLKDVKCVRNYRQGLSVIAVRGLLCDNCDFSETGGTPPQSGIDFEPNWPDEVLQDIVVRNCRFENNKGRGYEFYLGNLNAKSAPVTARFENCVTRGNVNGFEYQQRRLKYNDLPVGGRVELENCTFERSRHAGVAIHDKPETSAKIVFRNCRIVDCCTVSTNGPDVTLQTRLWDTPLVKGVDFSGLEIQQPFPRPKFSDQGVDWTAPGVTVPRRETFDLSSATVVDPVPGEMRKLEGACPAGHFTLALYVERPRKVTLRAQMLRLSKRPLVPAGVKVLRNGVPLRRVRLPAVTEEPVTLSFAASSAGFYEMDVSSGRHAVRLLEADVPVAVRILKKPQFFASRPGCAYFWTDAHQPFALFAGADSYEKGAVKLFSPTGGEAWARNPLTSLERYQPPAVEVKKGLWRIEVAYPKGMHRTIQIDVPGTLGNVFLSPDRYWR